MQLQQLPYWDVDVSGCTLKQYQFQMDVAYKRF